MNWDVVALSNAKTLSATSDAEDLDSSVSSLAEWLSKLFAELSRLPLDYEWNRISMELWLDSGRIIAYPALGSYEVSGWPFAVQLLLPFLAIKYSQIAIKNENDNNEELTLEYQVWMALRKAFRSPKVRKELVDLRKQKVFTMWRQSAGNLATANEFLI